MNYSELLKHHKSTFYLRILVSTFLRVKMPIAKNILETLVDTTDENFLNILKEHHNQYDKKDTPSYKEMLHNNIGHMNRIFNIFRQTIDFSTVKNYLDFGCGNGIKTLAIGNILNIDRKDIYGLDIKTENDIPNFYEYDGISIPDNLSKINFDMITCSQVLHHVDSKYIENILITLISMISNNGFLIIKDHDCFSNWMKILVDLQHILYAMDTGSVMPVKLYKSKKEWIETLTNFGMTLLTEFSERNDATGCFFIVLQKIENHKH